MDINKSIKKGFCECKACNGIGVERLYNIDDDTAAIKCRVCNGTGKYKIKRRILPITKLIEVLLYKGYKIEKDRLSHPDLTDFLYERFSHCGMTVDKVDENGSYIIGYYRYPIELTEED